jgi:hypothetical protein
MLAVRSATRLPVKCADDSPVAIGGMTGAKGDSNLARFEPATCPRQDSNLRHQV